jgi:GxxExxY protein
LSQVEQRRQDCQTEPSREHDRIAREIVDSAFKVHSALGPGLLESVYERCLAFELESRGLDCRRQISAPVVYRQVRIDTALRLDMLVGGIVVIEIKAVEKLHVLHEVQLLTYLKLTDCRLGLLINFNTMRIRDGIRRIVHSGSQQARIGAQSAPTRQT